MSVGYLIIFLVMQPTAYDHFKAMFGIPIKPKPPVDTRVSRVTRVNRPTAASVGNQTRTSDGADMSSMTGPKSFSGWSHSAYAAHDVEDAARETSLWNKSSFFNYNEEDAAEQEAYDQCTEEELYATLNAATRASEAGDELSTTNSTLHPSLSSAGSASTSGHRPGAILSESLSGQAAEFVEL